jgi:acyl dehydratase
MQSPPPPQDSVHQAGLIAPGVRLTALTWTPTRYELLQYAAASRDLNLIHHDRVIAAEAGFEDVIVQGTMKSALLARVALGACSGARLRRLKVQYRGVDHPDATMTAKGQVSSVCPRDGTAEINLWIERADTSRSTIGDATIEIPTEWFQR